MLQQFQALRAMWLLLVVSVGSTVMYWIRCQRAVNDGQLCRAVEKHVAKLSMDPSGAINGDAIGYVEGIRDRCEQGFSKSQAQCVLKAASMKSVHACD